MNNSPNAITSLQELLDDYTSVIKKISTSTVTVEQYDALLNEYFSVIKNLRSSQKTTAPEINIFNLAGLSTEEVKHSAILAWLLDPLETHAQENLFFKIFLETLKLPKNYANSTYTVDTEVHHEQGRPDIEVEGDDFYILIENKILSKEGDTQLSRYNKITENKQFQNKKTFPVYLTASGEKPSQKGFMPVSYFQVISMLRRFQKEAKAEKSKWVAEQYIELLQDYIVDSSKVN